MSSHLDPVIALRSRLLLFVVALLAATSCVRAPVHIGQAEQRDQLYSRLIGSWQGTLEYHDEQDSTPRVALSTLLQVVPAPDRDGLELRYTYEGPGTAAMNTNHWHFDRALESAAWGSARDSAMQHFVVTARDGGQRGLPLRVVLEGNGTHDARPARIRETIELTAGAVRVSKETQEADAPFTLRRVYTLYRAD